MRRPIKIDELRERLDRQRQVETQALFRGDMRHLLDTVCRCLRGFPALGKLPISEHLRVQAENAAAELCRQDPTLQADWDRGDGTPEAVLRGIRLWSTGHLRSGREHVPAAGQTQTAEQPWDAEDKGYLPASEAVVLFTDGKLPMSTLSKKLKPDGPIKYMRSPNHRCRVHIGDFRAWAEKIYPPDAVAAERASEYLADLAARKATERRRGSQK